jgi:hypothetical protein
MRKIAWISLSLIITLTAPSSFAKLPAPAQFASAFPEILRGPHAKQVSSLNSLMGLFYQRRPRREGITRGEEFCAISPGLIGDTDIIWSDRPAFLWQGEVTQITLRDFDTQEVLWSQALTPSAESLVYDGTTLNPGQVYQWELSSSSEESFQGIFQVMDSPEREAIAAEIQSLEEQLKTNGASAETIATERARYFAERGYWSDMLQALQTVETPSAAITASVEEMTAHVCSDRTSFPQQPIPQ